MQYSSSAIADAEIPRATNPLFQHVLDTYASETNKVIAVWQCFEPADLGFRPHPKSSTVAEILKHQLLSERRFFGEFVGTPEPPPTEVLPASLDLAACITRMKELARPRLKFFASRQRSGGCRMFPSSDSRDSASGFSGGASCTPAITAPSSPSIFGCSISRCRRCTDRPQTRPGTAPTPQRRSKQREESDLGRRYRPSF